MFCCIGKLKFNFRFPFVFLQLNLEIKNVFLFYRIIALTSTKTIYMKIIAN